MNIRALMLAGVSLLLPVATFGESPSVRDVTVGLEGGSYRVTYKLENGPAVVTFDVLTNGVSVGGALVSHTTPDSAVWRKVTSADADATGTYTIRWQPDRSGDPLPRQIEHAVAKVTAWPLTDTPDYMVVDITPGAVANSQHYYPDADFLPGGLFSNKVYRQTMLVMKKVSAKGVTWKMGDSVYSWGNATLDHNYYLAVFPTTVQQGVLLGSHAYSFFKIPEDEGMRPEDRITYNYLFCGSYMADSNYLYPNDPKDSSPLGVLRARTGLDFTLPSDAEWEFACRAGNDLSHWGNGSVYHGTAQDASLDDFGRYSLNGGQVDGAKPSATCALTNGTAIVGSYKPNDWGFYDMNGNVFEACLDWYAADVTQKGGALNIDATDPTKDLDGNTGSKRIIRGGAYSVNAAWCRPGKRTELDPATEPLNVNATFPIGYRLKCTAGLE